MKLAVGFILYQDATARYLGDFLPSLAEALQPCVAAGVRIYAYDNSALGREENARVVAAWQGRLAAAGYPLNYLRGDGQNLGFSRAYNILIRQAALDSAQFFLIINPDTKLQPTAISALISALEEDRSLGSVAPKILRWQRETTAGEEAIDSLGLGLAAGLQFFDIGQGSAVSESAIAPAIIGPSGAAGLFSVRALEQIAEDRGGKRQYFDERFFMYKEDCDLAYRLFLAGYKSRLVPEAIIYHDRSAARLAPGLAAFLAGRKNQSRAVRRWSFTNQHLLFLKHWPRQSLVGRLAILGRAGLYLFFALIFEQFLLVSYRDIWRRAW